MWLPIMPLQTVLFPGMPLPLRIFEDRYLRMVRECLAESTPFGVALVRQGPVVGGLAEPHEVGTTAEIVRDTSSGDELHLVVVGRKRFRIHESAAEGDLLRARVSILDVEDKPARASAELCTELAEMLAEHVATVFELIGMPRQALTMPQEPELLSFMVAAHLTTSVGDQQELLEVAGAAERLVREREMLRAEREQYRTLLAARRKAAAIESQGSATASVFSRN